MAKKRYANVVEMMGDLAEDRAFVKDLGDHLARRRLVAGLAALRAARGLTQGEIAKKTGFTQGRISKIETSTDCDLNLSTLVKYADAVDCRVEIALVSKQLTLVDRVKHHAFSIKKLTDHLARLGSKDEQIADGVAGFLKEAAYNLVRLIQSSAKLLPSSLEENSPALTVETYGVDECGEDESGERTPTKKEKLALCGQ